MHEHLLKSGALLRRLRGAVSSLAHRSRLLAAAALLLCAGQAQGYIIIDAPMTDTNPSGWVVGGNPNAAVLTGNNVIDPAGQGWLRLTNNTTNQTGFAYNNTPFDLSAGALIQFDYATWGGTGADGYSVFLFDANVPSFNPGAFGGSLGYAQKSGISGVSGGYVGIGVDEYGNFSNPTEGRYQGPGFYPNTITIRGPVVGFGGGATGQTQSTTSYPWIATSATAGSSLWYNNTTRPDQYGSDYRKVIIRISPAPNPVVDVWVQFGYNSTPTQMIYGKALPAISASQQLKIGYAASTGGSTNYHEIRNLLITSVNASSSIDLGITKETVATGTSTPITGAFVGNSFQYLITARNYGPNNVTAAGVGIVDDFPSYLTPGSWSCSASGGAVCGAATGSGDLNSTANIPMNGSVTYRVNATLNSLPPGGTLSNTARLSLPASVKDYYAGNNSATDTIKAYGPPTAVKSFSPATILPGGTSTLSIVLSNPNDIDADGVTFTDNYPNTPGALRNTASAARTNTCGGSSTGANGGTNVRLTNSANSIPANGNCTVTIRVTASTVGTYVNSTGPIATSNLGTGAAATGTLVVMGPPTAAKSFTPASTAVNGTSQLSITITNPNDAPITGAAFTDNYPAGLRNTDSPDESITCTGTGGGGTVTAADNGTSVALSGATIPAKGSCTVTVNVRSASVGSYTNSTGSITTGNSGTGSAASATLRVLQPPTVTKSFSQPTILPGGTSVLTVTLANPNAIPITGVSFNDSYPAQLFNGATPAGSISCTGTGGGGTVTAAANGTSLALSGATIPANSTCTVTANVTASAPATYTNSTGTVTTANAGEAAAASGTLVVMAPPVAAKSFSPVQVPIGGTTLLSVTLTNPNGAPITGAAFTDLYPSGMKNSAAPAGSISCSGSGGGGTVTAAANGTSLALSGATIPANGSCTVSANVTITATGAYSNSTGNITTANAGTGAPATASLNGPQAPSVATSFTPSGIPLNATSLLTVTLGNANDFAITGVAFTDSYPAGLVNGAAPNATVSCTPSGGGGSVTAVAGGNTLSLTGGSIPPKGSCTVSVTVTSASAGSYGNSTGSVTTTNAGSGSAAGATLLVMAPPVAAQSFAPASVLVNTASLMTITLSNSNSVAITGAGFTDSYPAGMVNTQAPGAATTCSGATVSAAAGGNSLSLSGATIPPGGSCSVTVNVTSAAAGSYNNSTGPIASGNAGTGSASLATLTAFLLPAPTVAESFAPDQLRVGGSSLLTITLTNPNATAITGASFTDAYPAGLVNTSAPGAATTCTGGSVTAAAAGGSLSLSGATIPANGSCTVTVNVTGSTAGSYSNSTGSVTSNNASPGAPAIASVAFLAPPQVSLGFTPASVVVNTASLMTITLVNPNGTAITGASFTDSYPAGLVNTSAPAAATTCTGGTVTAAANGNSVTLSGATVPANGSCTVTVKVTSATTGSYTSSTGTVSTSNAGSAAAASGTLTATLLPAPTVVKSFSPAQIARNGTSLLSVTLTNNGSVPVTGVAFSDTLPATPGQMSITTGSVLTNSCGGTGTIAGSKLSFSLAGGTIPANGSCSVSVTVTAGTLGSYLNTTSSVTATNANTALPASATLTVALLAPPTVQESFTPNQIGINGTSTLTITLSNPNGTDITGAAFTDLYPSGLVNGPSPAAVTTCSGGTVSAAAGGGSLSLSGATIPAGGSCSVTVTVTGTAAGSYLNSTGAVTTSNASTGSAATASISVLLPPEADKAFAPAAVPPGATSQLTVTLTNPNSIAITGASFSDSYPAGLTNTATPAAATTCIGGTVTASANGSSLSLSGATIPGDGSCTVTVNVKGAAAGMIINSTGPIGSSNAGTGSAASGTLVVMLPPVVTTSFTPDAVQTGASSLLTITLANPNGAAITGAVFNDSYPAGLFNSAAPGASTTCPGGSVSAAANGSSLQLSGGSIPAGGSCSVTVTVASATAGSYTNSTGSVTTGNAGSGAGASDTLGVYLPPTAAKAFGVPSVAVGSPVSLTLTLANPAVNGAPLTALQLDDPFPAGMLLKSVGFGFAPAGCGSVTRISGAPSAAGDAVVRFSVPTLAAGASCQVIMSVTAANAGNLVNSTGAPSAAGPATLTGAGASATLAVQAMPLISVLKSADRGNAGPGEDVVFTIEIANSGGGAGSSIVLTDDLGPYASLFLAGGAPFTFTDSTPPSGLAPGAPQYSSNNAGSWGYTPATGGGGAPAGYDGGVTNWRIPMTGNLRPGGSFRLDYRIKVK